MANENVDILLDDTGDDLIADGDFAVGDGTLDDVNIILKLNKGALKSDVLMGPGLRKMINDRISPSQMKQVIMLSLKRDNKNPSQLDIVNGVIKLEM